MEETFQNEQMLQSNKYTRISRPFHNLSRWSAIRLQVVSEILIAVLATWLFYFSDATPGNIGFSLEMASESLYCQKWLEALRADQVRVFSSEHCT